MFLDVGVQDSKSNIVDASAKVMPHMTYNIIVQKYLSILCDDSSILEYCVIIIVFGYIV